MAEDVRQSPHERGKLVRLSDGASPEEPVHPLTPGTRVGAWRVKAGQGQGAYGAVYRAVRRGWGRSGPVALKVSLLPWNWRMEREAEMLSRLSHPSIPRLLDRSGLKPASGAEYPFIVMEWVEGKPLYAWAEQHAPSGKQLCRVLAQLARALEAVHAAGAVHRDVKGGQRTCKAVGQAAGAHRLRLVPLPGCGAPHLAVASSSHA
jgi:serine/threonine protein kinase